MFKISNSIRIDIIVGKNDLSIRITVYNLYTYIYFLVCKLKKNISMF